ncbi:FAD-dependent oxidoreductase [Poriferisphaera sp. WC338]|uniref:FAD-dependent oxidoreductase n=1 Tax=Poriferisphaera sp. WC338 TaxID=3425129 RepID=UPI003D813E6A
MREVKCDVLIVGGGLGGVAAAIAACEAGRKVVMTEETDWVGGQMTAQAVPPDESKYIESRQYGTRRYHKYRDAVRDYYRTWFPLRDEVKKDLHFNPGGGWVSYLCHLPGVGFDVIRGMLLPFEQRDLLKVMYEVKAVSAEVVGDEVKSVTVREKDGEEYVICGKVVLDATEVGELLPLVGCEYATGFESQDEHNEPSAPAEMQPLNMQGVTWCFAMDHVEGDCVIDKPEGYEVWRQARYTHNPDWHGKVFQWQDCVEGDIDADRSNMRLEWPREGEGRSEVCSWWGYRQIFDPKLFRGDLSWAGGCGGRDSLLPGITMVNWTQNDYYGGNVYEVEDAAMHRQKAKELSLCWFYWMQTEGPRLDGGVGYPGLRMRGDVLGTADGFAKSIYIRESRRIKAMFTLTENHLSQAICDAKGYGGHAARFWDSVGQGHYHLDLHPSTGGDTSCYVPTYPYEIPMGSLVPVRLKNLLPACKNFGTTHLSNGCAREHPIEWNVGEVAGVLADECIARGESMQGIYGNRGVVEEIRERLVQEGVKLNWSEITF